VGVVDPVTPEERAQQAAEERLELAYAVLNDDVDDEGELAGAFCGCLTCTVREVLDAAAPHLFDGWEADRAGSVTP
jgi:hypothetical protein